MNKITASLALFNSVIGQENSNPDDYFVDHEHGVVISPCAMHERDNILKALKSKSLKSSDLNNTSFYKSWVKVQTVSLEERLRDQVMHYFSTYGLMSLGLDSPDFVYIPNDEFAEKAPKELKLRVIKGVSKESLIEACMKMLGSGVALQGVTIQLILEVLSQCSYQFTGTEKIANREAKALVVDLTGILPADGEELFRYLLFKATGKTLVIKDKDLIQAVKTGSYGGFSLGSYINDEAKMVELSKSFHRYKPLWLAFKSNKDNRSIVNRIAKLAKKYHVPQKPSVLGNLTSQTFDEKVVAKSAENSNIYQLFRSLNAVNLYSEGGKDRYYKIRNGKSFAKVKESSLTKEQIYSNTEILRNAVKNRVKDVKVYIPDSVDYAVPISEKLFSGNIPKYTKVSIPYGEEHLLVGVYWVNKTAHADLDLSAVSLSEKVGWNSSWRSEGLMYSGDVTSASNGASEWLHCAKLNGEYLVKLNRYRAPEGQEFKIILGYGSSVNHNYMIDPQKVVFSFDCKMDSREKILGLLKPNSEGTGADFYLIDQFFGNGIVSSYREKDRVAQSAILSQVQSCVRLRDVLHVVNTPEEADVVLEPNELSKDSILSLFY